MFLLYIDGVFVLYIGGVFVLYIDGVFVVEIEDTAAATRCEVYGTYKLKLTNQHVCLIDPKTDKTVLSWLFRYEPSYYLNNNYS